MDMLDVFEAIVVALNSNDVRLVRAAKDAIRDMSDDTRTEWLRFEHMWNGPTTH